MLPIPLPPTLRWPLLFALLAWPVAFALSRPVAGSQFGLILGNVVFALAGLAHAGHLWGWPRTWRLFGLTAGLSLLLEALSVTTHLATPYFYTPILGVQFLGVPLVIPLGWFTMLYASHVTVNLLLDGNIHPRRGSNGRLLVTALLTAFAMTAWDLTLDPYLVGRWNAWVWANPSGFLGIPFANYVSWLELTFIISVCHRVWERDLSSPPPLPSSRIFMLLPLATYGLVGLSGMVVGYPETTKLLPPFSMGILTLVSLGRLLQISIWRPDKKA